MSEKNKAPEKSIPPAPPKNRIIKEGKMPTPPSGRVVNASETTKGKKS